MAKKKPRPRTRKPGAFTDFEDARDELRAHGPRARWALDELERMAKGESTYGTLPPALTILCIKEILAYEGLPKALQFKAAEGVAGDTNIVIQVASWAAGQPARPLPPPQPVDAEERAHAGLRTLPTSPPRDRLAAAARNAAVVPILEVPPQPDQPRRVVAEMSMRNGLKRRPPVEPRAHEAAPDTAAQTDFNPFNTVR